MMVLAIVAFVLAGGALVASIVRGAKLRAGAIWWFSEFVAVGLMCFGALAILGAAITPTHVVDANGHRYGLGGPGPFIALFFGVVLWLLGAVGAALLYRGLPRARVAREALAAEEAELRATIAQLPGG